jgi:hypothetical protein
VEILISDTFNTKTFLTVIKVFVFAPSCAKPSVGALAGRAAEGVGWGKITRLFMR